MTLSKFSWDRCEHGTWPECCAKCNPVAERALPKSGPVVPFDVEGRTDHGREDRMERDYEDLYPGDFK